MWTHSSFSSRIHSSSASHSRLWGVMNILPIVDTVRWTVADIVPEHTIPRPYHRMRTTRTKCNELYHVNSVLSTKAKLMGHNGQWTWEQPVCTTPTVLITKKCLALSFSYASVADKTKSAPSGICQSAIDVCWAVIAIPPEIIFEGENMIFMFS